MAAVPHAVRCLKYPLWLTRDWDAHYTDPSWDDYADAEYPQNSPEELRCYRAMYAQFIEAALTDSTMDSKTREALADTTRLSLLSTILEAADTQTMHVWDFVDKVYKEIEKLVGDHYDDDSSEISGSEKDSYAESEDTRATDFEDTKQIEADDQAAHCERCITEKMQAALLMEDLTEVEESQDHAGIRSSYLQKPLPLLPEESDESDEKPIKISRKAKVGKFVCLLGEKGFKKAANVVHRKKMHDVEASQTSDTVAEVQTTKKYETAPEPSPSSSDITQTKARRGTRLRESIARILRRAAKNLRVKSRKSLDLGNDVSKKNQDNRLKAFLKWLIAKFDQILHKAKLSGPHDAETTGDLEAQMGQLKLHTEDAEGCPKHHKNFSHSADKVGDLDMNDVWNRIVLAVET